MLNLLYDFVRCAVYTFGEIFGYDVEEFSLSAHLSHHLR